MFCAISGEPPETPVISTKSGALFEKRLIESYIQEHGKDPVNQEALSTDDLIAVKSNPIVRPRPPTANSLPALLSLFQSEWDAIALETYTLRQQLSQTRQELSTALYQHDAACRVIARLTQERDEARSAVQNIKAHVGSGDAMAVDGANQLPSSLVQKVDQTQQQLSAVRRKRKVPENWVSGEQLQQWTMKQLVKPTGRTNGAFAVHRTGLVVSEVNVYIASSGQLAFKLNVDEENLSKCCWVGDCLVTGEATGAVKIWDQQGNILHQLTPHSAGVTGICAHPCHELFATASTDKTWALHDLSSGATVYKASIDEEITTAAFHPDGHLLALGTDDATIKFFEVRSGNLEATFGPHAGPVTSITFSENGYWLAASSQQDSTVRIWDLRKATVTHELSSAAGIESLDWDSSAQYLAIGGSAGVQIYGYTKSSKAWSQLKQDELGASDVAWSHDGSQLVIRSLDGSLDCLAAN